MLDFINSRFKYCYQPLRELSIDETLVATKGKSVMRQYIPTKSAKYGVKFWMLVEAASGYVMQMHIYRGKTFDPTPARHLQGTDVVHQLLSACDLLNKGYHVFCDSFFASLNLAQTLLEKATYLTGTLRKNRPMPTTIKTANINPGGNLFMRRGSVLCVAHRPTEPTKKPVRLVSTYHSAIQLQAGKPRIISSYNRYMGGVDNNDAMLGVYSGERKSIKVWKKMLIHLCHRVMLNAYILYSKNTSDRPVKSRLRFTQEAIEGLVPTLGGDGQRQRVNVRRRRRMPTPIEGRKQKDCCVCSMRQQGGVRRRSRYECLLCNRGLHKRCSFRHNCVEQ